METTVEKIGDVDYKLTYRHDKENDYVQVTKCEDETGHDVYDLIVHIKDDYFADIENKILEELKEPIEKERENENW